MSKIYPLAFALTVGCLQSRPEIEDGACEVQMDHPVWDDDHRADFEALFEDGPHPSMDQGDTPEPLSVGDDEYMNPLFHDEVEPGFLGRVGPDAHDLYGNDWSELSQVAFETGVLFMGPQSDAELCITGQQTLGGIHQTTYDVIYSPGYTMSGPAYSADSFVVQVDEASGNVWVVMRGEPTAID